MESCIIITGGVVSDAKLSDPAMTTKDNPLAGKRDPLAPIKHRNMHRLMRDAKLRECPHNGSVYSGIMNTRYEEG